MSEQCTVMLVGASGLVGRSVIELSIDRPEINLVALARREIPLPREARMVVRVAQPEDWREAVAAIAPDAVICALGTTIRQVNGDKEQFAAVDRDLVRQVANAATQAHAETFVLVSSVGANRHSKNFYLRTKGEAEEAVTRAGFRRVDFIQPGLLRGRRDSAMRPLEALGRMASPLTDLFLQGERRAYRSIKAVDVAAAALQCTRERAALRVMHRHDDILRMARKWQRNRWPS